MSIKFYVFGKALFSVLHDIKSVLKKTQNSELILSLVPHVLPLIPFSQNFKEDDFWKEQTPSKGHFLAFFTIVVQVSQCRFFREGICIEIIEGPL